MNKKKILIFRNDRLGDLIVTTPLLKTLKSNQINADITLVASKSNLNLALNYKHLIDECIVLENKSNMITKLKIYRFIISKKYDHIIVLRQNTLNLFFSILFSKSVFAVLSIDDNKNINLFNSSIYYYLTLLIKKREIIDWRSKINDVTHVSKHYLNLISDILITNKEIETNEAYTALTTPFAEQKNKLRLEKIITNSNFIHFHLDQKWFRTNSTKKQIFDLIKKLSLKINNKQYKLILTDDNNDNAIKDMFINNYFNKSINKNIYTCDKGNIFLINTSLEDLTSAISLSEINVTFHSGYIVHTSNSLNKKLIDFHEKTDNIVYRKWMSWQKNSKQYLYIDLNDVIKKILNEI